MPREVLEASKQVLEIATAAFQVYTRSDLLSIHDQLGTISNMKELNIVTSVIIHSMQSITHQYNYLCRQVPTLHYMDSQHQWLGRDTHTFGSHQIHSNELNSITLALIEQYDVLSDKISATIPADDSISDKVDLSSDVTHYSYVNAIVDNKRSSSSKTPLVSSSLFNPALSRSNPRQHTAYLY